MSLISTPPYPLERKTTTSAGYDIHANQDVSIQPGQRQVVDTGIYLALKSDTYGQIHPRSGLAVKYGLDVLAGVIDADYRDEVKVVLINYGSDNYSAPAGTRIAQLIIHPFTTDLDSQHNQSSAVQRSGGFGSTE